MVNMEPVFEFKADTTTKLNESAFGFTPGATTISVSCLTCPYPVRWGISLGLYPKASLLNRLIMAIESGDVLSNPEVKADVNGDLYIATDINVFGFTLESDLTRLGY